MDSYKLNKVKRKLVNFLKIWAHFLGAHTSGSGTVTASADYAKTT